MAKSDETAVLIHIIFVGAMTLDLASVIKMLIPSVYTLNWFVRECTHKSICQCTSKSVKQFDIHALKPVYYLDTPAFPRTLDIGARHCFKIVNHNLSSKYCSHPYSRCLPLVSTSQAKQ